jgi:thiol-disulfide isomerase/thioredoxin
VAAAVLLLAAGLLLGGCSTAADAGSSGAPDKGYVVGDGTVSVTPADRRGPVVRFSGRTLDGEPFDLADHRGDVVVVNVWGSWCPPCIAEAPALQRVWEQTRGSGVQFVGVNTRDRPANARAHERRFGVTYPSVDDDGGRVLLAFRDTLPPTAIPSTLVLDASGRVAARVLGEVSAGTLRALVDEARDEPGRALR